MLENKNKLLTILLFISIYFTTIVYSAFDTRLQIEGDAVVRTDQSIRITNLELTNTENDAYEEYNSKYGKDTTSMYLILPASSSITYTVEITNKVSDSYLIDSIEEISNTNNNIGIDISLNINDIVESNSTKTFTITITNETLSEQSETLVVQYGFKLNRFTVAFDANGGSVDTSSKTVSYHSTYGTLPTPTREGYTFKGWNGKNLLNLDVDEHNPSNINFSNESYRTFTNNSYLIGLSDTNYFVPQNVSDLLINNNSLSFKAMAGYGIGFPFLTEQNQNFVISYNITLSENSKYGVYVNFYDNNGQYLGKNGSDKTSSGRYTLSYTTPINAYYMIILFTGSKKGNGVTFSNIQFEEGDSAIEYEPYYITSSTSVVQPNNHTLKAIWETEMENNVVEYSTPNSYEFIAPYSGTYKIELWGAEGGGRSYKYTTLGGKGAYVTGIIELNKSDSLYVFVGEYPEYTNGNCSSTNPNSSFNGSVNGTCSGGGGATDIRLKKTANWYDNNSLASRIMVAGAGGGAIYDGHGGNAGELSGFDGVGTGGYSSYYIGRDATQLEYFFGKALVVKTTIGGSGYYSGELAYGGNSGGGSSYISGYSGCIAITSETDLTPICNETQASTDVSCSYHYSGYKFTEMQMIGGDKEMLSPTGSTEIGHTGNGFARITFIG